MTALQPMLRPQQVSQYLGIPPSALSRQTAYTIGSATIPPGKRGAAAGYSTVDALLINLGRTLIDLGLMPHKAKQCTDKVRTWLEGVFSDPRYYEIPRDSDFEVEYMWWFLIGQYSEKGFEVELINKGALVERLVTPASADPQMFVNLYHWVGREMERLSALESK